MSYKISVLVALICLVCSFGSAQNPKVVYKTENLKILELSEETFVHISYLSTTDFGNVPCNGMIKVNSGEALIFDSPTNDQAAVELMDWLEAMKAKPLAVVATHFHIDCVGALEIFHKKGITSYALDATIALTLQHGNPVPVHGFKGQLELKVGSKSVYCTFFGEGHTMENIVAYDPNDKALFGGCLIKSLGAGEGNLEDANVHAWSNTVKKIKAKYPQIEMVIPGHGKVGNVDLLDYTIEMFSK